MVRISITTRNIGGDEELADALREILSKLEDGEVSGSFELDDEECVWAINDPAFSVDSF